MSIDIGRTHTVEVGYDAFCGALAARDLQPLWKIARQLMPQVPLPTTQAWLWKWDDVLPLARRAGELITLERGGEARARARQSRTTRASIHQYDVVGCIPVSGTA